MKIHFLITEFYMKKFILNVIIILFSTLCIQPVLATPIHQPSKSQHIIVFVWDGLRPDSVTPSTTPTLYKLMKNGVEFSDNHSSYPTFTMMNAASFATGDRAGKTGFFGNTLWHPGLHGNDATNEPVDFTQPVFTEDYKILQALNQDQLFYVKTLFNAAHDQQLRTAVIGKSGPAFMQDYLSQGLALDEKHTFPLSFAKALQNADYPLPRYSPFDFNPNELVLFPDNGSPTQFDKINYLADGVTPDPSDTHGSPFNNSNQYMMKMYLNEILLKDFPQLSVIWMRNPDTTEHTYGPGTQNYRDGLRSNDAMLDTLLTRLKDRNLLATTDIIIVSDHAHSTVSGSPHQFPLRNIINNQPGMINSDGFSVSGEVRTADLLTKSGFHAYDGGGCTYNPILSGIKSDGSPLHPTLIDKTGTICGKVNTNYTTPSYKVPSSLPTDAIIVAANGGSDYLYVPSHNKKLIENLVRFLASHTQFNSIFVDSTRYGRINGTIPLATVGIQNPQGRSPDIIVGFTYDANVKVNGLPGIEFSDSTNTRGMHGSFSPIDVHNFLAAFGPDFRKHFKDTLPSGNVDVAPTVAYLLGLTMQETDGRVLWEALKNTESKHYKTSNISVTSEPLQQLTTYNALNQPTSETQFTTIVYEKILSENNNQYFYFDKANVIRK